jgi:hypothetical protein
LVGWTMSTKIGADCETRVLHSPNEHVQKPREIIGMGPKDGTKLPAH